MQSHIYVVACCDTAGRPQDALWAPGYRDPRTRIFGDLRAATECHDLHADYDYTAPAHEPAEPGSMRPKFEVRHIPTVEAVYIAALDDDINLIEHVVEVTGCPPLPCDDTTPLIERVVAWIAALPREVISAALPASNLADAADDALRISAATSGASSVTHTYALVAAYLRQHAATLQRIIAHCLKS